MLTDKFGRTITYLRLSVTDRCNLRCFYCMPEKGMKFLPKEMILSYEEMLRLVTILAKEGVNKVRITGGEPFVRKDLIDFIRELKRIQGIEAIHITTNGVLIEPFIIQLREIGISGINLSLDTLDEMRFFEITRRNDFAKVKSAMYAIYENDIPLKINAVVMDGQNTDDIHSLAELARDHSIEVRFIEEMPFNGQGAHYQHLVWNRTKILTELESKYGVLQRQTSPHGDTSEIYQPQGFKGKLGIIAAFTRSFCGECNRIRITAKGELKTCLYDQGVLDLKSLIRSGASDNLLKMAFEASISQKAKDGFEAEKLRLKDGVLESMSVIGG